MIVFMATYAMKTLHLDAGSACVHHDRQPGGHDPDAVMGALSDRVGRRPMIGASASLLLLAYRYSSWSAGAPFRALLIAMLSSR